MGKVEEIEALVAQVSAMWSGDRRALYVALEEALPRVPEWEDDLAEDIQGATDRVVRAGVMLSDEIQNALASGPDAVGRLDWGDSDLGDPVVQIEVLLTEGAKSAEEEDIARCGGSLRVATFYLSAVLPTYALRVEDIAHERAGDVWTFTDNPELQGAEKGALEAAEALVREAGFAPTPPGALDQPVAGGWTDLCEPGEALLHDCLFSDVAEFHVRRTRFTGSAIEGMVPGFDFGWREERDRGGRVLQRKAWFVTEAGEYVSLVTDGLGRVTSLERTRPDALSTGATLRRGDGVELGPVCRWCGIRIEAACPGCAHERSAGA